MPDLIFRHIEDVRGQEVRAQLHGERRAGVHCWFLEWSPSRTVIYTEYDPGLVLEVHGHRSDHVIYILDGLLHVGATACPPGTMVLLEYGATFGPLVAGPEGTKLLEFYTGDPRPVSVDPDGYLALLAQRGIVQLPHPEFDTSVTGGTMRGIVGTRTNLEVRDVTASMRFYAGTLGLEPAATMGDPPDFALLVNAGGSLGLARADRPAVASIAACYVEVPDLDAVLARCEGAGAEVAMPLTTHPWQMRDFVLRDPDGHLIAVGERLA
jgi:predicted enzyme related to lactoylglutathione lyase